MARGLSAAIKDYTGPVVWLADLTLRSGAQHYFAEDAVSFGGQVYQPYLRISTGPEFSKALRPASAGVDFLNADQVVGDLLALEDWEGALCELRQFQMGIDQAVLVLRGLLTEQRETDDAVAFRVVSELDAAQLDVPDRDYSQLCTWRFGKLPCGYDPATAAVTEELAERTADVFSATTIGDTGLAMTVNEHADRVVVITAGTGTGQGRVLASNTATTLTLRGRWATTPDGTSKFKVFTLTDGAPKLLLTAASGFFETNATGGAATYIEDTGLAMTVDEHLGDLVRIVSGTGAGQQRKIGSNDPTRITIDAAEPDLVSVPDATSVFRVHYAACPKDFAPSCEDRARTQDYNGFPTLAPVIRNIIMSGRGTVGAPTRPGEDDRPILPFV